MDFLISLDIVKMLNKEVFHFLQKYAIAFSRARRHPLLYPHNHSGTLVVLALFSQVGKMVRLTCQRGR